MAVIHDLDESLRAFVRREALADNGVEVVFDAPTKDWASRRNAPTIDLYLYDIREDTARRHAGQVVRRGADDVASRRDQPPRWFKLSYLVTAWTQRPEDEHRLLSVLLGCFLSRDSLPAELLAGSLEGIGVSVGYTCALPPPQDRALSDVWSALGGELKPSLDLVVTVPFDLTQHIEIGPPVTEPLGVDLTDIVGGAHQPPRTPRLVAAGNGHGTTHDTGESGQDDSGSRPGSSPSSAAKKAPMSKKAPAARGKAKKTPRSSRSK